MPALLKLTVAACLALALLVGLGVWQLQRLAWKEGLIAQIEDRAAQTPVTLDQALALSDELGDLSYLPVRVEGRFHNDKERYLYAISLYGKPGWHVIAPLETANERTVLVDRGFVPERYRDPDTRRPGQFQDVVAVTGLIRTSQTRGMFVPDNDPGKNQWFSRNLDEMAASMFPQGNVRVVPFFLEAIDNDVPGGWPKGGQTRLELPNNHLQYAVTWFGLALCLVGVYGVYVWGSIREKRP